MNMVIGLAVLFMNGEPQGAQVSVFPTLDECRAASDQIRSEALLAGLEVRTVCLNAEQMDRGAGREISFKAPAIRER